MSTTFCCNNSPHKWLHTWHLIHGVPQCQIGLYIMYLKVSIFVLKMCQRLTYVTLWWTYNNKWLLHFAVTIFHKWLQTRQHFSVWCFPLQLLYHGLWPLLYFAAKELVWWERTVMTIHSWHCKKSICWLNEKHFLFLDENWVFLAWN